jgi:hypothetical protein
LAILIARTFFMIRRNVALSAALNVVRPAVFFLAIDSTTTHLDEERQP